MNIRIVFGFILAFAIGILCQLLPIPLPAPTALVGALVVMSMTLGYIAADRYLARRQATQARNSAGPVG
ncbi:MAG: hypothetical protein PsegKO_26760 [Pseudohongiellaceae bacterium]|jgi:XapX domain-containing protein